MMKVLVSEAHEVVQCLPLSDKKYSCVRCGLKGDIQDLFSKDKRCIPHYESVTSGWSGYVLE